MAWITPKTDWTEDDFFRPEDWDRIRFNLEYLRDIAVIYFMPFSIAATADKTVKSWLYSGDLNAIESNLSEISERTARFDIGDAKTFQDNGPSIDYAELNRIESACITIRTGLQKYLDGLLYADDELYADEGVGLI